MAVNDQLTAQFKQAALDIFNAMIVGRGELVEEKTQFDPVTGDPTSGAQYPVRMARTGYDDEELANQGIQPGDVKFIFLQDETPVALTTSHTITYDSTVYTLVSISKDPADVLWLVQGRLK